MNFSRERYDGQGSSSPRVGSNGSSYNAEATDLREDQSLGPGLRVLIQQLDPDLPVPSYARVGDAGADIVTRVDVTLAPGEPVSVPTGIAIALPSGYAAFVHPRSGLAARHGVTTLNAPGTIDSGYRGEIQVILINTDPRRQVTLRRGDRVAQLVVQRVERVVFHTVSQLPNSVRGVDGFGSTGLSTSIDNQGHGASERESTGEFV